MRKTAREAVIVDMITAGIIRNGANYLSHHLRKNDYWSEGEKEVQGQWIGEGASALALSGEVTDEPFEALRSNRNPRTGEARTKLGAKKEVAFVDVQLSAPKDVSVLAMVDGDERVRDAFTESVKVVLAEMEKFAAVRVGPILVKKKPAPIRSGLRIPIKQTSNYLRCSLKNAVSFSNGMSSTRS